MIHLKPYKGYEAIVSRIDFEQKLIAGRVLGIEPDMVTFYAADLYTLQKEFEISLDVYLDEEPWVDPEDG